MKSNYLCFYILLLIPIWAKGQKLDTRVYYEQEEELFSFFADNNELFPVTIIFDFKISNMLSSSGVKFTKVLPSKSNKIKVTVLKPNDIDKKFSYQFSTRSLRGDINLVPDESFIYDLPYKNGASYTIFQGYDGAATHRNINALDFSMKTGDEICASRSGKVVKVVEHNIRHCLKPECADFNNLILVFHDDGTFSEYAHIKKDGAIVEAGELVEVGQVIGYSGNVGYASGPHLHFSVFVPDTEEGMRTLKTLFRTGNGSTQEYLKEKKTYPKEY